MIRLLIFTCPKPFIKPFNIIQKNAIKSWKMMNHKKVNVKVILCGNENGVEENGKLLDCDWIPNIKKNKFGTPLVDDLFKKCKIYAQKIQFQYNNDTIVCCYINSDIITFDSMLDNIVSFLENKHNIEPTSFVENVWLLIGCRWDTDNVPEIDFIEDKAVWDTNLIEYAKKTGKDHGCWGIDYFIFSPETYEYIYPFALGKFVWDRWLVGNVFRRDSITVDITETNFIIHQNGPWYQFSTGGKTKNRKSLFDTKEVQINQSFDYYEKDINSGTRWETVFDKENKIEFIKKRFLPRSD